MVIYQTLSLLISSIPLSDHYLVSSQILTTFHCSSPPLCTYFLLNRLRHQGQALSSPSCIYPSRPFPFSPSSVPTCKNPNPREMQISTYPTLTPNQMNVTEEKNMVMLTDCTFKFKK